MSRISRCLPLLVCAACSLPAGGAAAQSPAPVEVVMPEIGQSRQTLELTGSMTARRAASLSPRLPGLVAEVLVDAGDTVSEGEVILRLDDKLAELAVAETAAAVAESRAALEEARRRRAEAERLSGSNFISRTEIEARASQVAIAEAAVARRESELATAEERLARHTVIAPFDGVISRRLTEAGEWVATGVPVAELVGVRELWLDVRAPQEYWADLTPDANVSVTLDARPGQTLAAVVHARVPVSDPSARTFLVRLLLENPDAHAGLITPGMSARARFTLPGSREVVRVPRDALIRYPDGTTTIWVVAETDAGRRAREIAVSLGRSTGDSIEIVSELDPLRPVIVRGNEVLTENQPVRIAGES